MSITIGELSVLLSADDSALTASLSDADAQLQALGAAAPAAVAPIDDAFAGAADAVAGSMASIQASTDGAVAAVDAAGSSFTNYATAEEAASMSAAELVGALTAVDSAMATLEGQISA